MNLLERFVNALNPCVHSYRVVEKLLDRPENPQSVTLIRECEICGNIETQTIKSPPSVSRCPPHKWSFIHEIKVYDQHAETPCLNDEGKRLPDSLVRMYRCDLCGEEQSKRLTCDGFEPMPKGAKK